MPTPPIPYRSATASRINAVALILIASAVVLYALDRIVGFAGHRANITWTVALAVAVGAEVLSRLFERRGRLGSSNAGSRSE